MYRKRTIAFTIGIGLLLLMGQALAQGTVPLVWSIQAHTHSIASVSFAADGQSVVSSAGDEAKSWQASDGSLLQTFPDHVDGVIATDISPDGSYLAVGYIVSGYPPGGVMNLWDVAGETVQATYGGCHVAFSPAGDLIASGGGGVNRYVYLHRVVDGTEVGSYYNGPGYITDVAFSPDGSLLAVANTNNTVRLWDVRSGGIARTLSGHTDDVSCIAFSPDGLLLAGGGGGFDLPNDSSIKIWRIADGHLLQNLEGHGIWVYTVAFHPGGQVLASSGRDSQTPYSASMRFWRIADAQLIQTYDGLATDLAYAPDGQSYIFGRSNGTLVLAASVVTGVASDEPPDAGTSPARLKQNFPNPFNPVTVIRFELSVPNWIGLQVFAVDGRRIVSLVDEHMTAGNHEIVWDGRDSFGKRAASGTYFYQLDAGEYSETKRMVLMK